MIREYPDRPIVGIGVVVWRGDRVLLVRRGRAPRLGQWGLPGGAQEIGETVAEAAAREVMEETGVVIGAPVLVDVIDVIERGTDGRVLYHYTLVDMQAEWRRGEAQPGDDASETAWAAVQDLARFGMWDETLRIINLAAGRRHAGDVTAVTGGGRTDGPD